MASISSIQPGVGSDLNLNLTILAIRAVGNWIAIWRFALTVSLLRNRLGSIVAQISG